MVETKATQEVKSSPKWIAPHIQGANPWPASITILDKCLTNKAKEEFNARNKYQNYGN